MNREKIFVDTSAWVALFIKNDINYEKAICIFEGIKQLKSPLYTSDYIIDETITTILGRGNHHQSVLAGKALFTSQILTLIPVAPDYLQKTWKLYQKYHDKEFSFTDTSSFTIMKDLSIKKAFSFDEDFMKVGLEVIGVES